MTTVEKSKLTRKDFVPPVDVRWCPGCGDYAILNSIQKVFPELGIPKEKFVVVSGIGCSSRFPYYMNTYGFHSIHGRAPTVVTGIKVANPDLSVWMVTGDGDGLSIGGNHMLHVLRRNVDVNVLLFNNKIYGLTKGQYSPTSEIGKTTKTSPLGSLESPINPLSFALASEATFVARTLDTNPKHMATVFQEAAEHKGASFVEIMQNCVIFNNKAWEGVAARDVRDERLLMLEHGKPLLFGKEKNKGIRLNGFQPEIVTIGENGTREEDILVHDAHTPNAAYTYMLTQLTYPDFPTPMGVFRALPNTAVYEEELEQQIKDDIHANGKGNVQALLKGREYWEVKEDETKPVRVKTARPTEEMQIMDEINKDLESLENDPLLNTLKDSVDKVLKEHGSDILYSVTPEDPISKAIDIFKEHQIGCIPVMVKGSLVGMLSERDILLKVVLKSIDRDGTAISTIMSADPEVIKPTNSIAHAINKLAAGGFRHLAIKGEDKKIGLISVKGLVHYIYESVHKGQKK